MNGVKTMTDKLRRTGRLRNILGKVLLGAAGVLLATGTALGAPASNQLLAVKMEPGAASPTVLIQTAEAVGYRYTVYDSFDPTDLTCTSSTPRSFACAISKVVSSTNIARCA